MILFAHGVMGRIMDEQSIGAVLRVLRDEMTQDDVAQELQRVSGLTIDGHYVSRWEREERLPSRAWLPHLAVVLKVCEDVLTRAVKVARQRRRLAQVSAQVREGSDVDRRKFLGAAVVAAGAASEPWGRLAAALAGGSVDQEGVRTLAEGTRALYLEEHGVPARLMRPRVYAHLDTIISLLPRAGEHRKELLVAAGETAALAGWMTWDLRDEQKALHYYGVAAEAGVQAGHPPLTALTLIYSSYISAYRGDHATARQQLASAQENLRGAPYAAARSWGAAREGEEAAITGDSGEAVRAVERAQLVFEYADLSHSQPWVAFLGQARLASMSASALSRIGGDTASAAERALAFLHGQGKANAVALADVAVAYVRSGMLEQGVAVARRAAQEAARGEVKLSRDRLRDLTGLVTERDGEQGRSLSEELHALLA